MSRYTRVSLMAAVMWLAACSSKPVHYYTLLSPPEVSRSPVTTSPFLIDVLPVDLPEPLDQPQFVVRQNDSGTVAVLDGERWVGPLGAEMRSALSVHLSEQLGTQDISGLPAPADAQVLRVKIQVRRLDAWPGRQVQLEAGWSLSFAGDADKARLVCRRRFDVPAAAGYPALVQAQRRAIDALAQQIAKDARRWSASRHSNCTPPTEPSVS